MTLPLPEARLRGLYLTAQRQLVMARPPQTEVEELARDRLRLKAESALWRYQRAERVRLEAERRPK